MSTVREMCACGAWFVYTSSDKWSAEVAGGLKEWREQHRHEMPTDSGLEREAHPQSIWEESWTRTT